MLSEFSLTVCTVILSCHLQNTSIVLGPLLSRRTVYAYCLTELYMIGGSNSSQPSPLHQPDYFPNWSLLRNNNALKLSSFPLFHYHLECALWSDDFICSLCYPLLSSYHKCKHDSFLCNVCEWSEYQNA